MSKAVQASTNGIPQGNPYIRARFWYETGMNQVHTCIYKVYAMYIQCTNTYIRNKLHILAQIKYKHAHTCIYIQFMYIPIQVWYRPCTYQVHTWNVHKGQNKKYAGIQTRTRYLMHSIKLP
jgi:hypothetical protein